MIVPLALAVGLVGWSLVGNLLVGDALYVTRNLLLIGLLLVLAQRAGASWSTLGLGRADLEAGVRWGWRAVAVIAVAVVLGTLLADHLGPLSALLEDDRADLPPAELAWHAAWRVPVGTALFEELAFRGLLLGLLLQATSTLSAVAISSAVFGLWHVAPTIVTLRINEIAPLSAEGLGAIAGAVVVTAIAGVAFCVLRLVSGSLLAPIVAHWATNTFGLLAAALTQRTG